MKPRRGDLDFAISDPNSNGTPIGPIESLEWGTTSGVRVNLGYRFPGEGWALSGTYTYLSSTDKRSVASPSGGILFATLTHPGFIEQVATADASTNINYNVLDIDIGRPFEIGNSCTVRVFGGGRVAWIDQNLNVTYDGVDANNAHVSSPISYDGGGLRVGCEGYWNLRWGFSVFVRGAGSLLVGHFRTNVLETNQNGAVIFTDVSDRFVQMTPVAEIGLGVAWHYENFVVKLGYEMTNWFNLVDSPNFVDDVHQGKFVHNTSDLSLDGLFLQVGLGY
jgi:hypothetical protein